MFQIMTDHVFDLTMLLEERRGRAESRGRVGSEQLWNSTEHGAPLGFKPRAKKGNKKERRKKSRQTSAKQIRICLITHTYEYTHAPLRAYISAQPPQMYKDADTETPLDFQIYNNRRLCNTEIKFRVHLAI